MNSNLLQITVFNVGQGDHVLIEFPEGDFGIIDFFHSSGVNYPNKPPVITYLEMNRKKPNQKFPIRFVHLSHYDFDHVKGLDIFLKWAETNADIKEFWLPGMDDQSDQIAKMLQVISRFNKDPNTEVRFANTLDAIKTRMNSISKYKSNDNPVRQKYVTAQADLTASGSEIHVRCLAPSNNQVRDFYNKSFEVICEYLFSPESTIPKYFDRNVLSAILLFRIGDKDYNLFFGGDADKQSIIAAIKENKTGNWNSKSIFIKACHHGAETSSCKEIWTEIISDKYRTAVAISAGKGNKYGHPNPTTLKHISETGNKEVEIYATNLNISSKYQPQDVFWEIPAAQVTNATREKKANLDAFLPHQDRAVSDHLEYGQFIGYQFNFDITQTDNPKFLVKKLYAKDQVS